MWEIKLGLRTLCMVAALAFLPACATTTYSHTTPKPVLQEYKTTAIVPFYVLLDLADFPAGTKMAEVKEAQKSEAFLFQEELYLAFAENFEKQVYSVAFQDVTDTNRLLEEAGMDPAGLNRYTMSEIGAVLGVDSIIYGSVRQFRNVNSRESMFGGGESDNVRAAILIYDSVSGDKVWHHDYNKQPLWLKKSKSLAVSMVQDISDKFPFRVE